MATTPDDPWYIVLDEFICLLNEIIESERVDMRLATIRANAAFIPLHAYGYLWDDEAYARGNLDALKEVE